MPFAIENDDTPEVSWSLRLPEPPHSTYVALAIFILAAQI
jgi:hypothetical protein